MEKVHVRPVAQLHLLEEKAGVQLMPTPSHQLELSSRWTFRESAPGPPRRPPLKPVINPNYLNECWC